MEEFWNGFITGFLIGLPIAIAKLLLYFKGGVKKEKKTTYGILSPLAILLGVIYGFFGDK